MPIAALVKTDFTPRTPEAARDHFVKKAVVTSDAFEQLSTAARQRAFRVAGVHKLNLVRSLANRVKRAIETGKPWPQVRRELMRLFSKAQIPAPSVARLRTMFSLNVQQSYNDARRALLDKPSVTRGFPFRQYLTVGNGTPGFRGVRATHAALHGQVFAWDDPFWNAHTPPWDFGCRCTFVALTAGQVKRMGIKVRDLSFVRKRIRVKGQRKRGIAANPGFQRGAVDVVSIEAELKRAIEEMIP